ncbi:Nucleosomal histone H3-Lys79 methylase [Cytospora paraplurivora]|uniref:Histone-lysine N-methyltransferase, H3 lysine-79 specific n=1 Tax=Cytospora paraplurivora TaxID=2898453 RepID=A0AAN9UFQ6_9PEZI
MFSKQPKFTPKTLQKPKIHTVSVAKKPSTPLNGTRATGTSSPRPPQRPSGPSTAAKGAKRSADRRIRASNSPLTSSDEHGHLAPPTANGGRKRIRSPATDSDRVAFESDGDSADDNDWENSLKRRKQSLRKDPNRNLVHAAFADLAAGGYKDGRTAKIIHAAEIVSLELGDQPCFPDAKPEELVVELQYPGSLTRERFILARGRDKLDVIKDIMRVVQNVQDTFLTPEQAEKNGFKDIIRQLERNSNDRILNLAGFKAAVAKYNDALLRLIKSGAIVANSERQHELSNNIIDLILTQVYDRVVTPKIDILKKYDNGTDNVYGELDKVFIHQALSKELQMTSDQVFVDLGSGVGNVVLQAALEIGCESWGCEMMDGPAKLAKDQHAEFRARCKLWGIQPGRVRFIQDDFTKNEDIKRALERADVVLANNFAFTPQLNDTLKIMFLDLKKGCKVVSLKNFVSSSAYHSNDIATQILDVDHDHRWPVKGVSWTDSQGDYFISTKK